MSLPKAVKIKKNGVEYISNVNRLEYTLNELIRAALRDTGKFICNRTRQKIRRRTGRLRRATQYWVKSNNKRIVNQTISFGKDFPELNVGYKKGQKGKPHTYGFYGAFLEQGVPGPHKDGFYKTKSGKIFHKNAYYAPISAMRYLEETTEKNISKIREIQAQYLSGLGTEKAEHQIDEREYEGE